MLEMESKVLQALEYRVASTTCYGFLRRYIAAGNLSEKQSSLVMVRGTRWWLASRLCCRCELRSN